MDSVALYSNASESTRILKEINIVYVLTKKMQNKQKKTNYVSFSIWNSEDSFSIVYNLHLSFSWAAINILLL